MAWKNVLGDGESQFDNVELIFPTQQHDVSTLVTAWKDSVKRIVVFGSSVTSACNPWSDLDVFVELEDDINLKKPRTVSPIDLWSNFDVDERLLDEINREGVTVFEK